MGKNTKVDFTGQDIYMGIYNEMGLQTKAHSFWLHCLPANKRVILSCPWDPIVCQGGSMRT